MSVSIRKTEPRDEARWRVLWDGYLRFYESDLPETITRHTWQRLMNADAPVYGIVAEDATEGVIGFANYLIHESTWAATPLCYLEDLYVDSSRRAKGVGAQLIDWLVAETRARGWSGLYWHTRETNYRARGLYDQYAPHSGFLRYVAKI